MKNMELYEAFRAVPDNAKKTIGAGKLKGFTDINPMWRIKTLTDKFGPCGIGWRTEVADRWTETAAGESCAWVRLNLYIKVDGVWSEAIEGVGGSKQNGKGQGDGINDEAYKMAYTDALSICCKNLGMAADVYFEKDGKGGKDNRTKYDMAGEPSGESAGLASAINDVYAADSAEALKEVWNRHKGLFGKVSEFKHAVANSPYNPNKTTIKK